MLFTVGPSLSWVSSHHFLHLLFVCLDVRLGQPVVEGTDPSQHMAAFPGTQHAVDPHFSAAVCPRLRVCRGHCLQQVRPQRHFLSNDHTKNKLTVCYRKQSWLNNVREIYIGLQLIWNSPNMLGSLFLPLTVG